MKLITIISFVINLKNVLIEWHEREKEHTIFLSIKTNLV